MDIAFNFDHSLLSMVELHRMGIRSTRWLEEVFEDSDSQFTDITKSDDRFPVHQVVGFSKTSMPLKYFYEIENDIVRSLGARSATKDEIKREFCPFCIK